MLILIFLQQCDDQIRSTYCSLIHFVFLWWLLEIAQLQACDSHSFIFVWPSQIQLSSILYTHVHYYFRSQIYIYTHPWERWLHISQHSSKSVICTKQFNWLDMHVCYALFLSFVWNMYFDPLYTTYTCNCCNGKQISTW